MENKGSLTQNNCHDSQLNQHFIEMWVILITFAWLKLCFLLHRSGPCIKC